jgi:hypothetical protein
MSALLSTIAGDSSGAVPVFTSKLIRDSHIHLFLTPTLIFG